MNRELALEARELRDLAEVFAQVSIAPLGREYLGRYREIRESIREMADDADGGVSAEELAEYLDGEDLEFMASVHDSLATFAEEGIRREGSVEPYSSTRDDADRLEPFLDLLRPHFG